MVVASARVLDCGVDYITSTATHQPFIRRLYDVGYLLIESEASEGNSVRKWRGLGYAGTVCGSVSVGIGEQGAIVRLSSGVARDEWVKPFLCSTNTTRLDVQVTVRFGVEASVKLREHWEAIGRVRQKMAKPQKAKLISDHAGPQTIMLGSRSSDRYGRIYDKGLESQLPELQGAVRYEMETKNIVASTLAKILAQEPLERARVIPPLLQWIQKRTGPLGLATYSAEGVPCPGKSRAGHDKIRWIGTSVRPCVTELVRLGRLKEVIEALGLSEQVTIVEG